MKKLVWRESLVLAELKNLYGVASKSTVIPQKAKDDSQLTVLEELAKFPKPGVNWTILHKH